MIGGVQVTTDKSDIPVAVGMVVGALLVAASFQQHGWIRLGMQVLGGVLLLPLVALISLMLLGGAVAGLTSPTPKVIDRGALGLLAILIGAWLGSYTPGNPQELAITPFGLLGAGYLLRAGRFKVAGIRRRAAASIAILVITAGVTGVVLLRSA